MEFRLASPENLETAWQERTKLFSYALQPIVSIHTGVVFGYEALLRDVERADFDSIAAVFDNAYEDGVLPLVNRLLLLRAFDEFISRVPVGSAARLFFNIDNRVLEQGLDCREIKQSVQHLGGDPKRLCIEVSEQTPLPPGAYDSQQFPELRSCGVSVALDDFGTGYSGLQALYRSSADLIKIDRFFVTDIDVDATKHLFVTNLVGLAHAMGLRVVAEGIETEREFYMCRDIGCDYVQGYLVARPILGTDQLEARYYIVPELVQNDRRRNSRPHEIISGKLIRTEPIQIDAPLLTVLNRFRSETDTTVIPVVNDQNEPLGVLREKDLKAYVYSPYGISLLMNKSYRDEMFSFVEKVPVISSATRLKQLLEIYAKQVRTEAVIVVDDGKYIGYLDSRAVLQIVHDSEIALARDQNPLSKLPGNNVINEVLAEIFAANAIGHIVAYLDFNEFKPFNDTYGFRHGDRVIQLFANLLKESQRDSGAFVGHVGGDDFFISWKMEFSDPAHYLGLLERLLSRFSHDVRGFYDVEDGKQGYITAKDREGNTRQFGLLTASAAVFEVPAHTGFFSVDSFSRQIAHAKKQSKLNDSHIEYVRLKTQDDLAAVRF